MSIAELIKEHTDTQSFREYLQVQHGNITFECCLNRFITTLYACSETSCSKCYLCPFLEFISGVDTDKVNPHIEKLIAIKEPLVKVVG